MSAIVAFVGRVMMAALFVLAGINKLRNPRNANIEPNKKRNLASAPTMQRPSLVRYASPPKCEKPQRAKGIRGTMSVELTTR